MTNNNDKDKTLNPPQNSDLPFFAYGIFKPGQLAYSKIEKCVKKHCPREIDYEMLMRDGIPLIIPSHNKRHHKTVGHLIYFKEEFSNEAYKIISKNEHEKMYEWKKIKVGENRANVLMGAKPEMGSSPIEGSRGNYDGRNDPYFKEAIEVVENELNDKNKH